MNHIRLNHHVVIELVLLVGVIILLFGSSPAAAKPVPAAVTPVPGGPGFITVPSCAFVPSKSDSSFIIDGVALINSGTALIYFRAPIYLPHGATINKITMYYYDNSAENPILRLVYSNMAQKTPWWIATASGTGASATWRTVSSDPIDLAVDLSRYSYYLDIELPVSASIQFAGARVDYTFSTNLPVLAKESN